MTAPRCVRGIHSRRSARSANRVLDARSRPAAWSFDFATSTRRLFASANPLHSTEDPVVAQARVLRVLAVFRTVLAIVALFLSTATLTYVATALPTGSEAAHQFGTVVAFLSALAGFLWIHSFAFRLRLWEPIAWACGLRIICLVIPFDPYGLVLLGFAAVGRVLFARRHSSERSGIPSVIIGLLILFAAGGGGRAADQRRLAPGGKHRWCLDDRASPLVVLGDSSAYGMFVASDLTYASLLGAVACAEPGASSRVLQSQAEDAHSLAPRALAVQIGPNDRFAAEWQERIRVNLSLLIQQEHAAGRGVYLLTYPFGSVLRPGWLVELNDIIRDIATTQHTPLIDLEHHLRHDSLSFLVDDVHPSPRGHRRIADLLRQSICPESTVERRCEPVDAVPQTPRSD